METRSLKRSENHVYCDSDEGRFGFQDSSAPSLSDDVVVLGEEKEVKT